MLDVLPGLLIVLCFIAQIAMVISYNKGDFSKLRTKSITYYSASKELRFRTRIHCFTVAILTPVFITLLCRKYFITINFFMIFLFVSSMVSLIVTSITVSKNYNKLHFVTAVIFFVIMLIIELYLSISVINNNRILGIFGTLVLFVTMGYSLLAIRDKLINGHKELIILSLSAFWVIMFTFL